MWWKITIAAVVAIALIVVIVRRRCISRRQRVLEEFNEIYALPLPEGWVIPDGDVEEIMQWYITAYYLKKDTFDNKDLQSKKEWYNLRLKAFYDVSVMAECDRLVVKYPYEAITESDENLRRDIDEDVIVAGKKTETEEMLNEYHELLRDDHLAQYQAELQEVNDKKTGIFGIFRMSEEEKTRKMHAIYTAALSETKELQEVTDFLSLTLDCARIAAYKNIHLGVEVLSFNRDNVGGRSLTTEKSLADIGNIEVGNINFEKIDLDFSVLSSFTSGAINTLDSIASIVSSDKEFAKLVGKNPKMAGAAVLVGGAINLIDQHLENREKNAKVRAEIVEAFGDIVDQYTKCKGIAIRIVEIAEAIVKANNGFVATYAPLRDKVFVAGEPLSMADMQALALVISEYKKISMAKL